MTVGVNDRRAGPFTGDAVETVYGYDFTIVLNTDLEVYLYDTTTEVETLQTISTHYSVDLENQEVTFVTAPTADEQVLILGREPVAQDTNITIGDSIALATLQELVDRTVRLLQQAMEILSRCPRLERITTLSDLEIPVPGADEDGFALTWDNTAGRFSWTDPTL